MPAAFLSSGKITMRYSKPVSVDQRYLSSVGGFISPLTNTWGLPLYGIIVNKSGYWEKLNLYRS